MGDTDAAIALTRFGMGARPGEIAALRSDPRGALRADLEGPAPQPEGSFKSAAENIADTYAYLNSARAAAARQPDTGEMADMAEMAAGADPQSMSAQETQRRSAATQNQRRNRPLFGEMAARTQLAIAQPLGFRERWVRFWSNHFSTSARNPLTAASVGPYEREAIRPHVTGSFSQLLLEVVRHPAMITFLDNQRSVGPNSRAARSRRNADRELGLNENLAREILELHTLGVNGGYTQGDVEEFARALTGWSLNGPRLQRGPQGAFAFHPILHEPGARTVLGKRYREDGEGQARAILADLARHPATATHVAEKLARHFIADEPPAASVEAIARVFLGSDGDLVAVAHAVIDQEAAWQSPGTKMKTPEEFMISAIRGLDGGQSMRPAALLGAMRALGHVPFSAPSPAGWPDTAEAWANPDALKKRLEWALAASGRVNGQVRPDDFLQTALGPLVGGQTQFLVTNAGDAVEGLALAMMSPEFQRR